ncbi:hypothetical protein CYMTET_23824 [Cymbomonas tetramitiformis]|uniref:Uncharacterized protein n=1 Tax=Cymbomonas tetramitiformis TaxID=36881 RepID=A0AAE0L0W6_9CHLO|nr:hypothetical protein CYMTET_23824 [Cymbomonas tetramitiformis]
MKPTHIWTNFPAVMVPLQQGTHATPCPARATLGKHEDTSHGGRSFSFQNARYGISASSVRDTSRALPHHMFYEVKLDERLKEESALAVMDLVAALTAQTDNGTTKLQDDTEAC